MSCALPAEAAVAIPADDDRTLAQAALRRLQPYTECTGSEPTMAAGLCLSEDPNGIVQLPKGCLHLLVSILAEMARGRAVTVVPVDAEMTTGAAAALLNVSRPYFVELLEKGAIPYRKLGLHRRVRARDVLAYKEAQEASSRCAMEELVRLTEELGLYE